MRRIVQRGQVGSWIVRILPWALFGVPLAMAVGAIWLGATRPLSTDVRPFAVGDIPFVAAFVVFCAVGAVIVRHRPGHPIGWLLVAAGGSQITYLFTQEYAVRSLAMGYGWPGGEGASWIAFTISPFGLTAFALLILFFPTGRPPSPRWRWVTWLVAAAASVLAVGAVATWPLRGVEMLAAEPDVTSSTADTAFMIAMVVMTAAMAIAISSLVVRFWRSRGEERQQLKWVALGSTSFAVVVALDAVGVLGADDPLLVSIPVGLAVCAIPASIGIAILRYRLYDIERIISRVVSYAVLTLLLVGVYVAGVVGLGSVLPAMTSGAGGDLVVAVSTLVVAVTFGPLRRRVQGLVDRRFDRGHYDAGRELDRFSGHLRDEVDIGRLVLQIEATADSILHPRSAGLWLRPEGAPR